MRTTLSVGIDISADHHAVPYLPTLGRKTHGSRSERGTPRFRRQRASALVSSARYTTSPSAERLTCWPSIKS